ncbi:MAG: hypothetical protein JOZ08_26490 [Verrucomicrobia bacterium]|nr:hypothetical protein [Verrucomicrobiota bacterium]MBV8279768.1 hypothetical protein [Verrucomicrobiota bacterium]
MIFEILFRTNVKCSCFGPVLLLSGVLLLAGCTSGSSNSEYVNPSRPETYDPQETGYEKPWPYGDLGNGH